MAKTKVSVIGSKVKSVSKNSKKRFKHGQTFTDGRNQRLKKFHVRKSSSQQPLGVGKNVENKMKGNCNHNRKTSSKISGRSRFNHLPLREKMLEKLKAAKFRYINEQLYKADGKEMQKVFNDEKAYSDYHEGFRQQVAQWPINPVDIIIKSLLKRCKSDKITIADFGCGEAKIAESLQDLARVHSFDLVAVNDRVTQCDMAHTQLQSSSVDVTVFCLSLMGTNLSGYLKEANRVLKDGGLLKIAEVESRFNNVEEFVKTLEKYGFESTSVDLSHQLFYFFSFKKVSNISKKRKNKLPEVNLKPCLYKKR